MTARKESRFLELADSVERAEGVPLRAHFSRQKIQGLWSAIAAAPAADRPRLLGIAFQQDAKGGRLTYLFGDDFASAVVTEMDTGLTAPSVCGTWPYAAWWEKEIAEFQGVNFSAGAGDGGIQWQRA